MVRNFASVSRRDRKSTRLNSSHLGISYAVFCLKKKKPATKGMRAVEERFAAPPPTALSATNSDTGASSHPLRRFELSLSFFFNDPATPEIYTLSLPDALPISRRQRALECFAINFDPQRGWETVIGIDQDRKSTRLNSSHLGISYAVFCLK